MLEQKQRVCALAIWLAVPLAACGKKAAPPPAEQAKQIAPGTASTTAPASSGVPFQTALDLAAQFHAEATDRPSGSPQTERVLAALRATGASLADERQHLARPFGASYCVGAVAGAEVAVSVCEYRSEQAARAGREASLKAFASVAHREIAINRATTLTLRELTGSAAERATAAKLRAAFERL